MKFAAFLVAFVVVVFVLWLVAAWAARARSRQQAAEQLALPSKTATDMARLLERGLADPLYRTSGEWEERARELVRRHYGDEES